MPVSTGSLSKATKAAGSRRRRRVDDGAAAVDRLSCRRPDHRGGWCVRRPFDGSRARAGRGRRADGDAHGQRGRSPVHENWKQLICTSNEGDTLLLNRNAPPCVRAPRTERGESTEREGSSSRSSSRCATSTSAATWKRPSRSAARSQAGSPRCCRWRRSSAAPSVASTRSENSRASARGQVRLWNGAAQFLLRDGWPIGYGKGRFYINI